MSTRKRTHVASCNDMLAEKRPESIRPEITGSSSLLASTYGDEFLELIWQNGQALVQGGSSSRSMKRPFCFGYSMNPSHEDYDSHQKSLQTNDPCSNSFDLKCTESNSFNKRRCGDELSNLRVERESDSKPTGGNTQLYSTSLKTQKYDLGSDKMVDKINFSNFLRPALFFKSTYQGNSATRRPNGGDSARVEEIEFKSPDGGSSKAIDHSVVIDSTKGSQHSLNGVHHGLTAFTSNNKANSITPFDGKIKKDQDALPDEQSEAVGFDRALESQGSHVQYHHQVHSNKKAKTTAYALSSAPFVASSSMYSLGASNDSRKHEDTDESTDSSDNDEETEDTRTKETPAQNDSRGKRIRNSHMHNLSERKRRDKINKKMRALKQLIPNCNKVDKASMLDDAIDYLKSLKLQLQVLSMGSGVGMPLMMSMLGIGLPCSLPLQFLPHPQTNIANNSPQMIPGFPNHVLPNIQFPISQQSPFISMPPKPIQPYLSSHLSTFDHNSDLNARLASAAMPKVTKGSK